jgi:hypothetical protein
MMETNAAGDTVLTQWFERARFEYHPDKPREFKVLLGLLGNEVSVPRETPTPTPMQPTPTPMQPTPTPITVGPCDDAPAPVNARVRPSNCVKQGTVVEFDIYGFQPNEEVGFWLTAPDGSVIGTVRTVNIGPSGEATSFEFDTGDFPPGIWYLVFQGVSSKHTAIVYIKILPR